MSDPVRNDYDGPFLHILRHYKPAKAYLFMTRRVCELADHDDRYRIQAQNLCASEGFNCEIIELRHEEIDKPHEFDIFYSIFEKIINRIHKENPGCEILINLSSGTPQMKSACQILGLTSAFPVTAIQVTTPNEQENYGVKDFDVELSWENNIDNDPSLEKKPRTKEVKSTNLRFLFLREAAISSIKAYDYSAAFDILQSVREFVPKEVLSLVKAAVHRKNIELKEAQKESKSANYNIFPIESGDAKELFEYLLLLKIQQESGQLMDFVRGITPALSRLFEAFLSERCQVRIKKDFCVETKSGSGYWIIKRDKLAAKSPELLKYYDSYFNGAFKDSAISCATLMPMIEFECRPNGRFPNKRVLEKTRLMRKTEEAIRNPAAHTIKAIKEEEFIEKVGISSEKLLKDMQWLFNEIYGKYFNQNMDAWNSYDVMNDEIIRRLKQ